MKNISWEALLLAFVLAPLVPGIVNRVKAMFAGRRGQPLFQLYFDLWRLLHKGAVYSRTTTWVFRAGPMIGLASVACAMLMLPQASVPAALSFTGDFLVLFYLLGLARFFTVAAALDTGSAFEGMGASREVFFAALTEIAVFLSLIFLVAVTGQLSLTPIFSLLGYAALHAPVELLLVAVSMFLVLLVENSRIPIDDPNTHLELTMIHEVMVLDHSGPDFAFILYGSALKLILFSMVFLQLLFPYQTGDQMFDLATLWIGVGLVAAAVGVVESVIARVRLVRVPQFIAGAWSAAALGLILFVVRSIH